MISRWMLQNLVLECVNSIKFMPEENRKARAERIAAHIGVSRATLYNWSKLDSAQEPSLNQFLRLLFLARGNSRGLCWEKVGHLIGISCKLKIEIEKDENAAADVSGSLFGFNGSDGNAAATE